MSLITPLFLLGLLGIAFPWWLHRLEMQTTEREKFATTRFLEASKKRIHVQRKLKYLLLMALRMAFLALLAFAFARPILFDDPQIVASDDNVHHVIVIDTSFSMHEGTRLQQARTLAETILDNMDSGDVASLFAASTRITTLSEATDSADEVREQLPALIADNGRLDIGAMIASLNGLLEDSQAAVMLARLTMSFQMLCSRLMNAANSLAGPPPPTALSVAKRSVTALDFSALYDSSCNRLTISGGVPAGAIIPYHCEVSKSLKPISATVGTSGRAEMRCCVPTAMARSLPERM